MPELDSAHLDLPPRYLELVRAILQQHAADAEVWAYGSRVTGGSYAASDLDLVLRYPEEPGRAIARSWELADAFTESDLPIQVQVLDWARIPAAFRDEIAAAYVVVQAPRPLLQPDSMESNHETRSPPR